MNITTIDINLTGIYNNTAMIKQGCGESLECWYSLICPQIHDYFITYGLIIVISSIIIQWVTWYILQHMEEWDTFKRANIVIWLKDRVIFVYIMFTVIWLWFNINQGI